MPVVRSDRISTRTARRQTQQENVTPIHALAMGCMQAIGMLPGVSRSGSTIFGGVATRLTRVSAAKFSFMMSMPAIVASFLSEGYSAVKEGALSQVGDWPTILVGMLVAGVSGYLAIRFMMKIITRISLNWFALYVAVLGIIVIVLQATGIIDGSPETVARIASAIPLG